MLGPTIQVFPERAPSCWACLDIRSTLASQCSLFWLWGDSEPSFLTAFGMWEPHSLILFHPSANCLWIVPYYSYAVTRKPFKYCIAHEANDEGQCKKTELRFKYKMAGIDQWCGFSNKEQSAITKGWHVGFGTRSSNLHIPVFFATSLPAPYRAQRLLLTSLQEACLSPEPSGKRRLVCLSQASQS